MTGLLASVHAPGPLWAIDALQVTLLVLLAVGAALVVCCRAPVRQVILLSFYGVILSLAFFSLQAPDVTLSEVTVGAVVLPLLFLLGLAKMREGDSR